jgi:hypothetical protein
VSSANEWELEFNEREPEINRTFHAVPEGGVVSDIFYKWIGARIKQCLNDLVPLV